MAVNSKQVTDRTFVSYCKCVRNICGNQSFSWDATQETRQRGSMKGGTGSTDNINSYWGCGSSNSRKWARGWKRGVWKRHSTCNGWERGLSCSVGWGTCSLQPPCCSPVRPWAKFNSTTTGHKSNSHLWSWAPLPTAPVTANTCSGFILGLVPIQITLTC